MKLPQMMHDDLLSYGFIHERQANIEGYSLYNIFKSTEEIIKATPISVIENNERYRSSMAEDILFDYMAKHLDSICIDRAEPMDLPLRADSLMNYADLNNPSRYREIEDKISNLIKTTVISVNMMISKNRDRQSQISQIETAFSGLLKHLEEMNLIDRPSFDLEIYENHHTLNYDINIKRWFKDYEVLHSYFSFQKIVARLHEEYIFDIEHKYPVMGYKNRFNLWWEGKKTSFELYLPVIFIEDDLEQLIQDTIEQEINNMEA